MITPRITDVKSLDNFVLKITYTSNEIRLYDMKKNLKYECYKKLNNPAYFSLVKSNGPTIVWPDGEDIDPNELYENSVLI